jgi:transcriptional regulator with XRE-family HTH domain
MQEAIANFLRERRRASGKTQVQVAEEAFDDARRQGYVSTLERGEALPDLPTLLKLSKVLNFSLTDIEYAVSSSSGEKVSA